MRGPKPTPLLERLLNKVEQMPSGCWEWRGTIGKKGYGQITLAVGKVDHTHSVAYELLIGPVPPGLELDHLCRNRACCNPSHLEPVTHQENCRRAALFRIPATHCKHGHEYTPENTCIKDGTRICRACGRDRINRFREKERAA